MDILRIRKSPTDPWQEIAALVGPAGKDGYTPIKGTDYYTEEDKQEIVQLALAAVVNGNEVSY